VGDAWAHRGEEGRGKLRKARGSGTHALIPRWPNGATRPGASPVITVETVRRTPGTETSQYRQEEKSTEMAQVAASERARAQTGLSGGNPRGAGVVGPTDASLGCVTRSPLERGARDGDSPVVEARPDVVVFLSNARLEESGVKLGGPPSKAKDSCVTDSGRVP
jgi:hypothetical protein